MGHGPLQSLSGHLPFRAPVDALSYAAAGLLEASGLGAARAKSQKMTLLLTPGKGQISLY